MPRTPPPTRRYEFDGTLRTAYTQEERLRAQANINNITNFHELRAAARPGQARLLGLHNPSLATKYITHVLGRHEAVGRLSYQIKQIKNEAERSLRILQTAIGCLARQEEDLHRLQYRLEDELNDNLSVGKLALREADLMHFIKDQEQLADPSRSPTPESEGGSSVPDPTTLTGPREDPHPLRPSGEPTVVRTLSYQERQLRKRSKCIKCRQPGHWRCDHFDYFCPSCNQYAPGHSANNEFCPERQRIHGVPSGSVHSPIEVADSPEPLSGYPNEDDGYPSSNVDDS